MLGYLLINKPAGVTSHDVVDTLRRITHERRIGHAGTLDPFATGLLVVGVGREATRNLGKFVGLDKRYVAELVLGKTSSTYDRTGVIQNQKSPPKADQPLAEKCKNQNVIQNSKLMTVIQNFIGKQMQVPPQFSAKKVQGKKAYELARKGERVVLQAQEIEIYDIKFKTVQKLTEIPSDNVQAPQNLEQLKQAIIIEVHCSSGTYIRTLGADIGQKLGCGAYVEDLTRTAVGNFTLDEAVELSALKSDTWQKNLITFKTVMATGTFEMLHKGHEHYLTEAKKLGERLVVVLARQHRAERVKERSLRKSEEERLYVVKRLPYVDEALLGEMHDPYQSIQKIKPDIIALGYDQAVPLNEVYAKICEYGLKTKIARIGAYKPKEYKSSLM